MKQFYQSTYYLWVITKILFVIAVLISAIQILETYNLTLIESLANFVAILYSILLILDLILTINKNDNKFLKYVTGTFSIILGLIIFIMLIKVKVISIPITILFILWILLLGVFDLLQIKRNED